MKIGYDAKRFFHNTRGLGNYSRDCVRIVSENLLDASLYLFNPIATENYKQVFHSGKPVTEVLPLGFWANIPKLWRCYGITKIAESLNLDLYHGLSGEVPMGISKRVPTIVTIHDLIFLRYPQLYSFSDRYIHKRKFSYAAHQAHHIIAISEQTKRDIVEYLGIHEDKISVVYQGCHKSFKQEYSDSDKQQIRDKYGLHTPYVLSVGAIEKRKNALSIVKAIEDLDISLVLVGGETAYAQQVRRYVQQKNMTDRVHFLKGVSMQELAVVYQMAEVFCYPSVFEGFGIPIIEALFSKVPVITTKGYCFEEAGGPSSFYIDLSEAETQIRNCIKSIRSNCQQREQMVNEGFEFVQKFTDENVFKTLWSVYERFIN